MKKWRKVDEQTNETVVGISGAKMWQYLEFGKWGWRVVDTAWSAGKLPHSTESIVRYRLGAEISADQHLRLNAATCPRHSTAKHIKLRPAMQSPNTLRQLTQSFSVLLRLARSYPFL